MPETCGAGAGVVTTTVSGFLVIAESLAAFTSLDDVANDWPLLLGALANFVACGFSFFFNLPAKVDSNSPTLSM